MKTKITFHPELFSLILGVRWIPKQRNLYISIPFFVVRVHFWKPSDWKAKLTVYRVSQDGCVSHTVAAVCDSDAIDRVKRHLVEELLFEKDEVGDFWVEHRYADDEELTIQTDNGTSVTHTAKTWVEIDNHRLGYLACSEF